MHLEAETTLTKRKLRIYLRWVVLSSQKIRLAAVLVACVFLVLLAAPMIAADPSSLEGYLGVGIAVAVAALFLSMPLMASALQYRSLPEDARTLRFLFDDESFEVVNDHGDGKGKRSTFRYAALLRTVEDKDAFYLFIRKGQAFIVGKEDFPVGGANELGSRLQTLGPKHIRVK
jgi:hypothetical protein